MEALRRPGEGGGHVRVPVLVASLSRTRGPQEGSHVDAERQWLELMGHVWRHR